MHITMLGHSGAGKTTFMACMYAVLQNEVGGFCVNAQDSSDHDRLIEIANHLVEIGDYPAPTDQRDSYRLWLLHGDDPILDFTWVDYRGNALNESTSSAAARDLREDLQASDAILAFFDAKALANSKRRRNRDVGRMISLLGKALGEVDYPMPVALTVTKADLVDDLHSAVETLQPLIETIARSQWIQGAFIPTACGRDLIDGVQLPTLFSLHVGIHARLERLSEEIPKMLADAQSYESKSGYLDSILSWLKRESSWNQLAQRRYSAAKEQVEVHNRLVEPANALGKYLDDITRF